MALWMLARIWGMVCETLPTLIALQTVRDGLGRRISILRAGALILVHVGRVDSALKFALEILPS